MPAGARPIPQPASENVNKAGNKRIEAISLIKNQVIHRLYHGGVNERKALIEGSGPSALSCARLLAREGWTVVVREPLARPVPAIVLTHVTSHLLVDLWQTDRSLLTGGHLLHERVVTWRGNRKITQHSGVAIRGDVLQARLRERLLADHGDRVLIVGSLAGGSGSPLGGETLGLADSGLGNPPGGGFLGLPVPGLGKPPGGERFGPMTWTVDAAGRRSEIAAGLGGAYVAAGERHVVAAEVEFVGPSDRTALVETWAGGWLFLAPLGEGRAILQATVSGPPRDALEGLRSALEGAGEIGAVVGEFSRVATFHSAPRLAQPSCGDGWIAVGEAAMALDPICGDGTGYALRGAIAAVAVLNGIAGGMPPGRCLRHYQMRLAAAFRNHVEGCRDLYGGDFGGSAWDGERRATELALETVPEPVSP